jgi:hypothetical protein
MGLTLKKATCPLKFKIIADPGYGDKQMSREF